jgi:GntR family transcriptional regulator
MTSQGKRRELKYQRIANALRDRIDAGEFRPGDRLPGENDLMSEYEVARMTARQALGVLVNEGIAESRKGAGVYLREFRPVRRRGISRLSSAQWGAGRSIWTADIGDRKMLVDQLAVMEAGAPDEVASVLEIASGDAVCVRERRYVLDGKPVMLAVSYLPADLVADSAITRENPGPGGIYARLAELGHQPAHFREEIRSRMPAPDEAQRLTLPPGTPVIVIWRTAFTAEGRPVELNRMILDAASYVLEYDWDA